MICCDPFHCAAMYSQLLVSSWFTAAVDIVAEQKFGALHSVLTMLLQLWSGHAAAVARARAAVAATPGTAAAAAARVAGSAAAAAIA